MADVRHGDAALQAIAEAVTSLLNGGWLELCTADGGLLVALRLRDPAFVRQADGSFLLKPPEPVRVAAHGKPETFQALTPTGDVVFEGDVGDGLEINPSRLFPGDVVSVDRLAYRGRAD